MSEYFVSGLGIVFSLGGIIGLIMFFNTIKPRGKGIKTKVYCIDCRYNKNFGTVSMCRHPWLAKEIGTPRNIEIKYAKQEKYNRKNNCKYYEKKQRNDNICKY